MMPPPNLPVQRRKILIIRNPVAGKNRPEYLRAIRRHLQTLECEVLTRCTEKRGDAQRLAREALDQGFDVVAAAGGDGTINEVMNGLAGSAQVMTLIPLGTANALAAEMNLSRDPLMMAQWIATGQAQPVYWARANEVGFLMSAGTGLDAHVVAGVNLKLKAKIGPWAYIAQAIRELIHYKPVQYTVHIGAECYTAASIIVCNSHCYGGHYVCAPQANLSDPWLYVCLLERTGRWNALRYALALGLGWLSHLSDCRIIQAESLTIDGPPGDPVQLDGDIATTLPLKIQQGDRPLWLIMPRATPPTPGQPA
jgi:YegS/Rv2252/BmrU family lipid kinase